MLGDAAPEVALEMTPNLIATSVTFLVRVDRVVVTSDQRALFLGLAVGDVQVLSIVDVPNTSAIDVNLDGEQAGAGRAENGPHVTETVVCL